MLNFYFGLVSLFVLQKFAAGPTYLTGYQMADELNQYPKQRSWVIQLIISLNQPLHFSLSCCDNSLKIN